MNTVFDVLTAKIEESVAASEKYLSEGRASDYADYRYVAGQIRGLRTAQMEIKDLSRNHMEDNDDN
jgi:hypothetical protein